MKALPMGANIIQLPLADLGPVRSGNGSVIDATATFPKAAGLIQIKEEMGTLTLQDQKVLACLLYHACGEIEKNKEHKVSLSELRNYLGAHESNDQVRDSLRKLSDVRIDFDVLGTDGRRFGYGSFLQVVGHEVGQGGQVRYQFHMAVRPMLEEPAKWARLSMATLRQFQTKYGARLYENLEIYANRRVREWRVGVDDLRVVLGAEGVLLGWGQLNRRAVLPALKEVNNLADFDVAMEYSKMQGRRILEVTFHISKKGGRTRREEAGRAFKRRRGGEELVLRPETMEKARKVASGCDVYLIEEEWRAWMLQQGKPAPRNPDGAFIAFAKAWYKRRQHKLF